MTILHIIGLGSMGIGMAQSLVRAGHDVHGFDLNPDSVTKLVKSGGSVLTKDSPPADALVCVVLNADQTEQALFGPNGWTKCLKHGGTIISCATVSPDFARKMEAMAQLHGFHYLDAPISGGSMRAAEGALSIMASGTEASFEGAEQALLAMAHVVHRLGDQAGSGSAMKAVNQLLAGIHISAMGEALGLALSQGLDLARVLEVISVSAGTSWMFENRAPHVIDADYSPRSTINIWPKDLGIVIDIASSANLPLPLTQTALDQYRAASDAGLGHEDDAAITKLVVARTGISLPEAK